MIDLSTLEAWCISIMGVVLFALAAFGVTRGRSVAMMALTCAMGVSAVIWKGPVAIPSWQLDNEIRELYEVIFFVCVSLVGVLSTLKVVRQYQNRLEDSDRLFSIVTAHTSTRFFVGDRADGRLRGMEGMMVSTTSRSQEELWSALQPDAEELDRIRAGVMVDYRREHDRRTYDICCTTAAKADITGIGFVGVATDVTNQLAFERARQHAAEQELKLEHLEEIAAVRSRILRIAGHELNTPLTPLRLQLHTLNRRLSSVDGEDFGAVISCLDRNIVRMSRLVRDILDAARIDAGELQVDQQPHSVAELLQDTVEEAQVLAEERGVQIRTQIADMTVHVDEHRFHQVMSNLMSNSLKYTSAGGQVSVRAHPDADGVGLEVEDTGIGMSPEQVQRLFEPFTQVHEGDAQCDGTGLGLYLARQIIEQHGGNISCFSEGPGNGTLMRVWLPSAARFGGKHSPSSEGMAAGS